MLFLLLGSMILSFILGLLLVQVTWRLSTGVFPSWLLTISLASGVGAGLSSSLFVIQLFFINRSPSNLGWISIELLLLACLFTGWIFLLRKSPHLENTSTPRPTINYLLLAAWVLGMCFAILYFSQSSLLQPIGDWDGWTLWNMHAKYLAFGGQNWTKIFTEPLHPDYPLLTSGFIARLWDIMGSDKSYSPIFTAALFTFGTIGLLMAVLKELRSWNTALLGGLVLCCSSGFIYLGSNQYADVPLSFFLLAMLSLTLLHDLRFPEKNTFFYLIGLCAGFCLWTKNEGWLMLAAFVITRLAFQLITRRLGSSTREWGYFIGGLAPILAIALYYHSISPPNDMTASPLKSLTQLADPNRYLTVWSMMVQYFLNLGKWKSVSLPLLMTLFAVGMGIRVSFQERTPLVLLGLTLLVLAAEYFFAYILTPRDLVWHITNSLDRLLLHLFTALLLLTFLLVRVESKNE